MTIQLAGLHSALRPSADYAVKWAGEQGVKVEITSVTRDWATQTKLRARYESCLARGEHIWPGNPDEACRYPANKPGDSAHNYGLAWDSWVPPELMPWWVAVRRALGWRVPDNDLVHAELPDWRDYVHS